MGSEAFGVHSDRGEGRGRRTVQGRADNHERSPGSDDGYLHHRPSREGPPGVVRRSPARAGQLLADHDVTATSKRVPPTRQGGRIVCRGLAHTFVNARTGESVPALDTVDLVIAPGEFVTVCGPSGCGKTTLLRAIAGLITPTQGQVSCDDVVVRGPGKDQSHRPRSGPTAGADGRGDGGSAVRVANGPGAPPRPRGSAVRAKTAAGADGTSAGPRLRPRGSVTGTPRGPHRIMPLLFVVP